MMDTSALMFPKPGDRKKKKKVNGYKHKAERYCAYCGTPYAERHEIFGGPNRQNSIDHEFQIDVCSAHHRELQDNCTEWAMEENERLRRGCQERYEDELVNEGWTPAQARREWMMLIGRNYLDDWPEEE
ncbi:MAG: hypothetical protein IJM99_10085 [Firmicutes bacterium]|nr:hypothetical protein [Bacillota bacterium]